MALKSYVLSALAYATAVAAHGHVSSIEVNGKSFTGFDPDSGSGSNEFAFKTEQKAEGYVPSPQEASQAAFDGGIACANGSSPATSQIEVAAGGTVTLKWNTWPDSHHGPVIDYLANCNGECTGVQASSLKFFKSQEVGLSNGKWGADTITATQSWDTKIPADLAPGNYVLRHEIIALHSINLPQFYPQCVSLKVTGSGSANPDGVTASEFYKPQTDPGLTFNIYQGQTSYPIPGPALYGGGGGSGSSPGGGNSTTSAPAGGSSGFVTMTKTSAPAGGPTGSSGGNTGNSGSGGNSGNSGNSGSGGNSGKSGNSGSKSGGSRGSGSCRVR